VLSTNRKGAIAEMKITTAAVELGIPVLRPMAEHGRYDLGFEIGDRILRVQVKWGRLDEKGAVITASTESSSPTPGRGYVRRPTPSMRSMPWRSIAGTSTAATFSRVRWSWGGGRSVCACCPPETASVRALTLRQISSSLGL
jgi:hypothetical protein